MGTSGGGGGVGVKPRSVLLAAEWLSSCCHAIAGLPRTPEMGSMRMAAPEVVWQSARGLIMQMGCCIGGGERGDSVFGR